MAYRYHPEIEGLKVNDKGTSVIYLGETLSLSSANRKDRDTDLTYVYFMGKTHSVAKLTCECWHGMAENPRWHAIRREKAKGFHYTNLFWAPCGTQPEKAKAKRSSRSKIKEADVPVIKKRLKAGETLKAIAQDYNTSDMSISRIKKQMRCGQKSI